MAGKIGRNAPCPCGSGKKNKLCCLSTDIEEPSFCTPKPDKARTRRKTKTSDVALRLKVIWSDRQGGVRGRPYRVLNVPPGASLYELAGSITDAFGFDFDHAFGFYDNIKNPYRSQEGYELFADMGPRERHKGVKSTTAGEVFTEIKKKMLFLFDYGDEWRFVVQLVGNEPLRDKALIAVVEEHGEAPSQYDRDWDEEWDDEL
jgi:hypothetical protein